MTSLAPDDPRHGTYNGYRNLGCRCDQCRKAVADYMRAYSHRSGRRRPREVYLAERRANPPAHGTVSRYSQPHYCRCDECKRASREQKAAWRQRRALEGQPYV